VAGLIIAPFGIAAVVGLWIVAFNHTEGGTSGVTKDASNPHGYTLHTDAKSGFALALPPGWQVRAVPSSTPELRFLAGNSAQGSPTFASVAVTVDDAHRVVSLTQYAAANIAQLEQGGHVVNEERVDIPAGPAMKLTRDATTPTGVAFFETFYVLVHNHKGFAVTLVVQQKQAATVDAAFIKMIASFRFTS